MQTPESRRDQLQGLAGWLIIVPIVLAILFGCGQLALIGGAPARRLAPVYQRLRPGQLQGPLA